ncbi:MAG: hypothetical protein HC905_25565 [Bacteroidales bacterium]|nr:hypothetical protein [Bacteroidales bacterium]
MDFRYEDFLIQELIPQMELKYRLKSSRKSRAIAGLSMGGYGTVLNAFKYPDIFCAAYAMSAAIDMGTDAERQTKVIK